MTASHNPQDLLGRAALDAEGDKIGKIGQVYLDDQTNQPYWVTISTGLFGKKESFAPVAGAQLDGDDLRLTVSKAQVKDAPNVDADEHLDQSDTDALFAYYAEQGAVGGGQGPVAGDRNGDSEQDRPSPTGDSDRRRQSADTDSQTRDNSMVRSEEQVNVGTERVESGRARLRKYIVTENVTQTVPVSHEELRIEREPITDENRGNVAAGGEIGEDQQEVVLTEERAVVTKETVPVERVSLGTETVTGEQTIDEQVRKEQIETDQPEDRR